MFLIPNNFCAGCGNDLHAGAPKGWYNGHTCRKSPSKCTSCGGPKGTCPCILPGMKRSKNKPSVYYFPGEELTI